MLEDILIPLAGMATGIILGLPLIRAFVRLLERKTQGGDVTKLEREVEELRSRVETAEDIRDRLLDLEERVDFAERVLTQAKEQQQLGGGGP